MLKFEKDGKVIEVNSQGQNETFLIADYVTKGYTHITETSTSEKSDVVVIEPSKEQDEKASYREQGTSKPQPEQKIVFFKDGMTKIVEIGPSFIIKLLIISVTLSYISMIVPRGGYLFVFTGAMASASSILSVIVLIKTIIDKQFKLIFLNFFIISLILMIPLLIVSPLRFFGMFNLFGAIIAFLVYIIQVLILFDMYNNVNRITANEYVNEGYEILNESNLDDATLALVRDNSFSKPKWMIV